MKKNEAGTTDITDSMNDKPSKKSHELKFHAFNINRDKSKSQVFDFDV